MILERGNEKMKKLLWASIIALTLLTGCNGYIAENNNSPATYKNGTSEDTTGQTEEVPEMDI